MIAALCEPAQVELIAPEWRALLDRAPGASIFQTPEWCLAWWRAFGQGGLHVIVSRSAGGLDAIAPLYVRPADQDGPPSLVVIGTGNSDRLDVIAASRTAAVAVVDAAARLADVYSWRLEWRRLPRSSALLWACGVGLVSDEVPCPVLTLRGRASIDDVMPEALRGKVDYGRRRLNREGTLRFEWLRGADVQDGLTDLFQLHTERWAQKGKPGVLADPAVQQFHRDAAARLDVRGDLRLVRMRAGDRVAGIYYGFQTGHSAWFYIAGFDPSLSAASPGSVLLAEVIGRAMNEGVNTFDFLSGQEPYKYEWGAVDRPYFARTLGRQTHAA